MLGQQVPQRQGRGMAGLAIVADVEEAADLQLAPDEVDDDLLVLARHPAPHAVHSDVIEIRQVGAGAEFSEGLIEELCARSRRIGQGLREGGVPRIEIGAVPNNVGGGGVDVDAETLPVAELAGGGNRRRSQPDIEKRHRRTERVQFAEITERIANFGNIAVGPVAHRNALPFDPIPCRVKGSPIFNYIQRHSRASGYPGPRVPSPALDPRLRGRGGETLTPGSGRASPDRIRGRDRAWSASRARQPVAPAPL